MVEMATLSKLPVMSMLPKLPPLTTALKLKILRIAVPLCFAYVGSAYLGYGLAWRDFRRADLSVLSSMGRVLNGFVTSIQSRGFAPDTNYYIQVSGSKETFMIPFAIARQTSQPIDTQLKVGDPVYLGSSGGINPVVLELTYKGSAGERKILDYQRSAQIFARTVQESPRLADQAMTKAWTFFGLAAAAFVGLSFWVRRRLSAKPV